jgi:large subunit ribosomal protein L3
MKKLLIGRKLGMTQIFAEDGGSVPVTVIEAEASVVIQKKTQKKDGYDAIQLGYGRSRQKNVTKPVQGHCKKADKGFFRVLREFRTATASYELGQELKVDMFQVGDQVDVVGTTKGKGFAGVIRDMASVVAGQLMDRCFTGRLAQLEQVQNHQESSRGKSFLDIWEM